MKSPFFFCCLGIDLSCRENFKHGAHKSAKQAVLHKNSPLKVPGGYYSDNERMMGDL